MKLQEQEIGQDVDVSAAANDIKASLNEAPMQVSSLERVSAADPRLPDGRIPVNIKLDPRWFIFLGLFCAGVVGKVGVEGGPRGLLGWWAGRRAPAE